MRQDTTASMLEVRPELLIIPPRPRPLSTRKPTDLPNIPPIEPPTTRGKHALLSVKGIAASAKRLTSKNTEGKSAVSTSGWQEEAWGMHDKVGEQRFLGVTLAGRLSQARLYIGKYNEDDVTDDPDQVDDAGMSSILNVFGQTSAGRSQMIYRMAINLFVAGDGWFVGLPRDLAAHRAEVAMRRMFSPEDEVSLDLRELDWRMCSISEVSSTAGSEILIKTGPANEDRIEVMLDEVMLIRVWRSHPRLWWLADSPTQASLPVLRQLVSLTEYVNAQINSRLAGAGLLLVPQSAADAIKQQAQIDADSDIDVFTEGLIEAMSTAISDRSSAASFVPLVATVPDESTQYFKLITFDTPLDGGTSTLREEQIRRLALGQDAPPELLLGTSGMNHWGAWLVREDVVSTHLEPPLALICDALTTQFLWPILEALHPNWSEEEVHKHVIWYSVEHLITRPNRGADAFVLHERGAISDTALRKATGFDESDGFKTPTDEAHAMVLEMVRTNPALLVSPGLPELVKQIQQLMDSAVPPPAEPEPVPPGLEQPPPQDEQPQDGADATPSDGMPRTDGPQP